jgi:hypothetical protein
MKGDLEDFKVTICERSKPINLFENIHLKELFKYYEKEIPYSTLRLENNGNENHVMIIKFYRLLDNVGGMSSLTENGFHVGFIDVDHYSLKKLKENLRKVQKEFGLSTWYILRSSKNNYHCICLDKHSFGFWIDVLKSFDNESTLQYQRFAINRNRFVLRITAKDIKDKPELVETLFNSNHRFKSFAHWYFLNLRYGIKKPNLLDFFTKIFLENYTTVVKE